MELAERTTAYANALNLAARAESAATGHADAKDDAEEALENACHKVARALASHFKKTGDLARLAKVNYRLGYFQKLRDQHLTTAAADLVTIASAATTEDKVGNFSHIWRLGGREQPERTDE